MSGFRAELPLPPPHNNAYINVRGRGRVPSKAHAEWKKAAGWEVVAAPCRKRIEGPFRFTILLPLKMRGDVDGRVKLPLDLLVSLGITDDDKNAVSVFAERSDSVPAGRCIVCAEAA